MRYDRPTLWIIAGANGSGKTSAYNKLAVDESSASVWVINPDELSKHIAGAEKLELDPHANLEAVKRMEAWLYASIEAYQTVGVETVLSTPKYRKLVTAAKAHGFWVRLIYVCLNSPELNVERVATRMSKGGHKVDEEKIRDRRRRSFQQFSWFFAEADQADVYDNSGANPRLVATKEGDELSIYGPLIPDLVEALADAYPQLAPQFRSFQA